MLESGKMVGFVLTRDYEKARAFYEGKLGCEFVSQDQYALVMKALEKYPFIQDRELGIWTTPGGDRVAWFKDPDGNVLSVSQHRAS